MTENERGPVEIRTATIERIDYPERTIDLLVVPYDEWAEVEYRGKVIEEAFAPGAFGDVRARARKFIVNLEHDPDRWIGTVTDLDSANERGLRAAVKIRRTPDGDQALNDAADGLLAPSIGFATGPAFVKWLGETRRRVVKAFLDHIGMTATPAYLGSEVLEVRSAPIIVAAPLVSATPNLDRVLAERAELGYLRS